MRHQDIWVKVGAHRFNYRVAAVVRKGNAFLVCCPRHEGFCFLPGGRVQDGEATSEAIARELREELGIEAAAERPVFFVENFFSLHGERFHELCLYYEVTLPGDVLETLSLMDGYTDEMLWVDAVNIGDINLKPAFLITRLENLPPTLEHLVLYGS